MDAPPPQGVVTVMFTDVEGSTALAWQRGDEEAGRILGEVLGLVRAHLAAHEGREIDFTGDGLMASFASPPACGGVRGRHPAGAGRR
jgi:class 3 adenylate cyclase